MSICAENITRKAGKKVIVNNVSAAGAARRNGRTAGAQRLRQLGCCAFPRAQPPGCRSRHPRRPISPGWRKSSSPAAWLSVEQHGMTEANMRVRDVVCLGRIPHHSFSNWSACAMMRAIGRRAAAGSDAGEKRTGMVKASPAASGRQHIARALAQSPSELCWMSRPTIWIYTISSTQLISELPQHCGHSRS